jgi:cytochrome d ubiquinol oxidase subunit I
VKLAALEGVGQTVDGAPEHLLGYYTDGHVVGGIEIPRLLSLLAFHDPNATVRGLDTVPVADQPPVNAVRYAFQTMVGIGTLLALLGLVFLIIVWRRRHLPSTPWFYRALAVAGPLAFIALIAGWVTTELGRQPWVVYDVMRTNEAVTGASGIPVGYGLLAAAYAVLVAGTVWALRRLAKVPMPPPGSPTAGGPSASDGGDPAVAAP